MELIGVGFEAVTSIIFCVALSEYDQVLLEENGQVSPNYKYRRHRAEVCRIGCKNLSFCSSL